MSLAVAPKGGSAAHPVAVFHVTPPESQDSVVAPAASVPVIVARNVPFADRRVAERISSQIDSGLQAPGAREVTLEYRNTPRLAAFDGGTYLQPTVVLCDSPEHPLANREFLFPFAAVVAVDPDGMRRMPQPMGKTLVVTALTRDPALIDRLLRSPLVDRLNVGAIPTNQISWDQPHEGNLFEHLYARRSFQQHAGAALAAAGDA